MASVVRTGRVSAIDYKRGTYQVTYYDRGQSRSEEHTSELQSQR